MPLPIPKSKEQKDEFISRCIETEIMNQDFPNLTQRIAVCVSQWDTKDDLENAIEVRKNSDCPDGWEHQMPNGKWMCGKTMSKKTNY